MYILRTDDRPTSHFEKFRTAISRQRIIRSASRLVLGYSFRRIKCLYFRFYQIQDHDRQPSCIIFNGRISETVHPVQIVFVSRVKVQEKIVIRLVTIQNISCLFFMCIHFAMIEQTRRTLPCEIIMFINRTNRRQWKRRPKRAGSEENVTTMDRLVIKLLKQEDHHELVVQYVRCCTDHLP